MNMNLAFYRQWLDNVYQTDFVELCEDWEIDFNQLPHNQQTRLIYNYNRRIEVAINVDEFLKCLLTPEQHARLMKVKNNPTFENQQMFYHGYEVMNFIDFDVPEYEFDVFLGVWEENCENIDLVLQHLTEHYYDVYDKRSVRANEIFHKACYELYYKLTDDYGCLDIDIEEEDEGWYEVLQQYLDVDREFTQERSLELMDKLNPNIFTLVEEEV